MFSDVKDVATLIADFGIMLVISAIFLYFAFRLINILIKRLDTTLTNKKHDKLIDMRSEVGEKIQNLIEEYLRSSEGNRVHVIEFSNSVLSVAYLPFKYMTCTYEVYSLGKSATGHKIDRISTSLFTPFFMKLQDNPCCIFDINDKTTLVGGAMCDLMKSQNEHQALCAALKSAKGKFIGYVEVTKDEEFTESDIHGIQSLADQLSVLLSVADK